MRWRQQGQLITLRGHSRSTSSTLPSPCPPSSTMHRGSSVATSGLRRMRAAARAAEGWRATDRRLPATPSRTERTNLAAGVRTRSRSSTTRMHSSCEKRSAGCGGRVDAGRGHCRAHPTRECHPLAHAVRQVQCLRRRLSAAGGAHPAFGRDRPRRRPRPPWPRPRWRPHARGVPARCSRAPCQRTASGRPPPSCSSAKG